MIIGGKFRITKKNPTIIGGKFRITKKNPTRMPTNTETVTCATNIDFIFS